MVGQIAMQQILHITTLPAWEAAQGSGKFAGDTLQTEGFIHCSTPAQVSNVAHARYAGRQDLILLVIAPDQVRAEVRFELASDGEHYPHIYGPLNVDAVTAVVPFPAQTDGTFRLPDLASEF